MSKQTKLKIMEKYITLNPQYPQFKEMFKDLNHTLYFNYEIWRGYGDYCNLYTNVGSIINNLDWRGVMVDLPEFIELWKVSGECIGIHKNVPYSVFLEALKENGFGVPPFGTGLFIPLEFKKQNFVVPEWEEINVFSPISPRDYKRYKSWYIKLNNILTDSWPSGKLTVTFEHLRPTETWISPKTIWTVQNISNK